MNPHFIFNSLTAIHSFIIKSDVDNALLYMDKFSKLTRQTLEFSSCPHITLLDELEYLSHFIALENMRFGNKVQVHFNVGELDSRKIKIPPLLVQPLVENAFEHGFTNRQQNYHLYIKFTANSQYLIVTISDDGEGLKSKENADSKAIKIIRERLFLIQPNLPELFTLTREGNLTIAQFSVPLLLV
jgi:LytS/YehU family sensor histidine kinase